MKKIIFLVLGVIGFGVLVFAMAIVQPWVFLPHEHVSLILPFPESVDSTMSLIPMGEKIEHNESNGNPDGHPGLDFGFKNETDVLACADGIITKAGPNKENSLDITIYTGFYNINYKEVRTIAPGISFGVFVKQGQVIGSVGTDDPLPQTKEEKEEGPSRQIHWELQSASMAIDRLCPVGYFDEASRQRIEQIWVNVPETSQFKKDYPDICSGVFHDKED